MKLALPGTTPILLSLALTATLAPAVPGQATTRVSVTAAGAEVFGGNSERAALSQTGRFVAFESNAPGLVPGDTGSSLDTFLRDRALGTLVRVSVSSAGVPGDGPSDEASVSPDGRFVAFRSSSLNLDAVDTDGAYDIFLRDTLLGTTELMSKHSDGSAVSAGNSAYPALSDDGVWVAFESDNIHLVDDDTNAQTDVFVHNRLTGQTARVSLMSVPPPPPDKPQATGPCYSATISGDGRLVGFAADAGNLVAGDLNGVRDIFVRDRLLNTTTRMSVSSAGVAGDGHSTFPVLSADGSTIAFESVATNLVAGDTNGARDIFVHDLATGLTERVSVSSAGVQGNSFSNTAGLSSDGRYVSFFSSATTLVAGDSNGVGDVFVHDRVTHVTTRASLSTGGAQADNQSQGPAISNDGRVIAWESKATNLVPGDTNDRVDIFVRDPDGCTGSGGWTAFGAGLPGAGGHVPGLFGTGCPLPGATVLLHLDQIVGGTTGVLFLGFASGAGPFKGGTFHAGALFLALTLPIGGASGAPGAGALALPAALPANAALSGLSIFLQGAFHDAAAVQSVSLTQGLQLTIG